MANKNKTNKIILTGLMMALTTIATMVIAVPVPFANGYIHLGDSMVFLSVLVLGWRYGAVAAGVGSALADIFLGYVLYAPWTLCIKAIMAVLMGLVIEKAAGNAKNTLIVAVSTVVVWLGFHFAVNRIIAAEAANNPASLFSEEVTDLSQLGEFLNSMQSQLMVAALAIPVFLLLVTFIVKKKENFAVPLVEVLGMTLAGLWMVFGYYIAGGIMYGSFAVSAFSIPMNMIQFVVGFLVAALLMAALSKTPVIKNFSGRKKKAVSEEQA